MKKVISLILVLVMAFALSGCVKNTDFVLYAEMTEGEDVTVLTDGMGITLSINADNDPVLIGATVEVEGMDPIQAVITVGKQGIGISAPAFLEDYYIVEWAALKDTAEAYTSMDIDIAGMNLENLPKDEIMEIAMRYFGILSGLVTEENTSVSEGTYSLTGLQKSVPATVITITPSDAEWDAVLTSLISTLQSDDQLKELIYAALKSSYTVADDASEYDSDEAYAAAKLDEFEEFLVQAMDNKESIISSISGLTFEAGYDDSRIYGGSFMLNGTGIGYESIGEVSDVRYDALFLYSGENATAILANQLTSTDESLQMVASSQLMKLNIAAMIDKTVYTALEVPSSGFYFGTEGFEASAGIEQSEEYAVAYFDGLMEEDSTEFYIEAASDGTPSSIAEPDQEPVIISTMEELMEIISQVSSEVGA